MQHAGCEIAFHGLHIGLQVGLQVGLA